MGIKFRLKLFSASIVCALLTACTRGFIYTSTNEPYFKNVRGNARPVHRGRLVSKSYSIIQYKDAQLYRDESSKSLVDAARRAGISEVYFADIMKESYFGGIWEKRTVILYGD